MRMNWELIGGLVALAGAVLLAILILEWVKRWVRKGEPQSKGEELNHFRRLADEGVLTPEEFARVQMAVERRGRLPAPEPPRREEGIFDAAVRERIRAAEPPPPVPPPATEQPSQHGDGSSLPS